MKIVCVVYLHGAGGAERQIIMLANAMAKRKHQVHLLVVADNNLRYDIDEDVIIHDLTECEAKPGNRIINRFMSLRKALKEIKPDISIHYWFQSAYFCALMPQKITGLILYSERGNPGDDEYSGLLKYIRYFAIKRIDAFVFQSEGAQEFFDNSVKERSIVIHNSVAVPKNQYVVPCKNREKRIVNIGRLHEQKNQKLLIEAFSIIADRIPEYILEIYGDGKMKDILTRQIKELSLENQIFLKGTRRDILDCIYSASLFVLSSDYEGMPNALMEAMAIGVPSISTDCKPGGARTLVDDGINGWITPLGDVDALSQKMLYVIQNREVAECVAMESIKIRRTHSNIEIFDQWENFIFGALKNRKKK